MLRHLCCWLMIAAISTWTVAADAGGVISGKGVILRNGVQVGSSSAIFPGDLLETKADAVANLSSLGSSVVILPNSFVEFQGQSLSIEHGSVSVATSHGISVRVRCMTVVPLSSAWTQFEVTDVNGTVEVAAKKNNVRLETIADSGSKKEVAARTSDLREGEQASRDESAGCSGDKRKGDGAVPAGSGGILRSEYVKYGGLAAIGGVGLWLALDGDDPPSPYKP